MENDSEECNEALQEEQNEDFEIFVLEKIDQPTLLQHDQ